jgi:riboflavin kinase/FMN adenylyltransferase
MLLIRDIKKITQSAQDFKSQPLALTIGNFDGFHLGHQKIISDLKNISQQKNLTSAILTFNPHPEIFFNKNLAKNFRINSASQKISLFKNHQIDLSIFINFNQKIANCEAEEFVSEFLIKTLNVKYLLVGYDFVFGKNRLGNFELLQKLAKKYDFELAKISALSDDENKIYSSTLIRSLIKNGEIKEANHLMNRNFSISSRVVEGKKIARSLGFPTANLFASDKIINPKFGVYQSLTSIEGDDKKYLSITNYGIKPTINHTNAINNLKPIYETHLLNFKQNLYHKKISIELIDFIRDEKKFSSVEELKNQIKRDISILL